MGTFLFAAIGLFSITLLILLRPWQAPRAAASPPSPTALNASIVRDQLAEIERDLAAGVLAPADAREARDELQRRLLDDVGASPAAGAPRSARTSTTLLLALALPLGASGLYAQLGTPAAMLAQAAPPALAARGAPDDATHRGLDAGAAGTAATAAAGAPDVERMVAGLAAKLEKNPGDSAGWAMLARSYHALGRMPQAKAAFERIGAPLQREPALLAAYADVLATLAQGDIEGEPLKLVHAALDIDPDHGMALSLAATAAYKRGDKPRAAQHWRRLLAQVPPGSADAQWLEARLAEIGSPVAGR